jgi:hypothetical protein
MVEPYSMRQNNNQIIINSDDYEPYQVDQMRYDARMKGQELVDEAKPGLLEEYGYRGIVGGVREGGANVLKLLAGVGRQQAEQALKQSEMFARLSGADQDTIQTISEASSPQTMEQAKTKQEQYIDSILPVPDPKTLPGNILKGVAQFAVPYVGALKAANAFSKTPLTQLRQLVKGKNKGKAWLQLLKAEAGALGLSQAVFDPDDPNLANLAENEGYRNAVTNFLAVDPNDTETLNRTKMLMNDTILSIGGIPLARGLEKAITGTVRLINEVITQYKANAALKPSADKAPDKIGDIKYPDIEEPKPKILDKVTQSDVNNAFVDLVKAGKIKVKDKEDATITNQVADALTSGKINDETIVKILKKNDISFSQFATGYKNLVTQAGKTLGKQSAVRRKLYTVSSIIDEAVDLETLGLKKNQLFPERNTLQRVDDIRRGSLVAQLVTAVRNVGVGYARQGFEVPKRALDYAIQKVVAPDNVSKRINGVDILGQTLAFLNPAKQMELTREVLKTSPKLYKQIMRQVDDEFTVDALDEVAGKGKKEKESIFEKGFQGLENTVYALNVFNRAQDQLIRSGVFAESLNRQLKNNNGSSLEEFVNAGQQQNIPKQFIDDAVKDAMDYTFSDAPTGWGKGFVNLVNSMRPVTTSVLPFPRFLVNAMKFNMEYSPLGFFRPAKEILKGTGKIAEKDYSDISKAIVGSGALLAASEVRDKAGGEKWYEIKRDDGTTVDMRSAYPMATYLYVADVINRANDETLFNTSLKDLTQGISGVNFRGGTGLYLVDELAKTMQSTAPAKEKINQAFSRLMGEYVAGFFVPVQQFRDLVSPFDPESQISRSSDAAPFAKPIYTKFPFGTQMAQAVGVDTREAQSPLRDAPFVRTKPFFRQLFGVTINAPKNPFEAEIDRLQIGWRSYGPGMRDRRLNDVIAYQMGINMEDIDKKIRMENVKNWDWYKQQPLEDQRKDIKDILRSERKLSKQIVRNQFGPGTVFAEKHGNPFEYEDYLRKYNTDERLIHDKQRPEDVKAMKEETEFAIQKLYEELEKLTTPQQPAIQ